MVLRFRAVMTATVALMVAVSTRAQGQPPFEGAITMRVSSGSPRAPQVQIIEFLVRNGRTRINVGGPAGVMSLLTSPQEKKVFLVMAAQNSYMEMPMAELTDATSARLPADMTVTRTKRIETIAGYVCEYVTIESPKEKAEACLAAGLGGYLNPLAAMQRGTESAWQRALSGQGGFPLKLTLADGSVPLEVTKIEKKRLAPDLFAVPLNFTKMEMPVRRPP